MPMPSTYQRATEEWRAFLEDVKSRMDLVSDNMAYTAVDGVFQVFRRRLTAPRAILVKDWDVTAAPFPFADRETMTREAQELRRHHNLTPDNAIEATAWAVRRCTDPLAFERVLATLPQEARNFWRVDEDASG